MFALNTAVSSNTGLLPASVELAREVQVAAEQAIALDDGSAAVRGYASCALIDLGHVIGVGVEFEKARDRVRPLMPA